MALPTAWLSATAVSRIILISVALQVSAVSRLRLQLPVVRKHQVATQHLLERAALKTNEQRSIG
jgi:hypothetical protein